MHIITEYARNSVCPVLKGSDMQIDLSVLFAADGEEKTYTIPFTAESVSWNGVSYPVKKAEAGTFTLKHRGNRVIDVKAGQKLTVTFPCDRCLTPVDIDFHLMPERRIDANVSRDERIRDLDEQPYVQGNFLDTDRLILDELYGNMPVKVLCREDCKGLCPVCGQNLNIRDCGHGRPEPDLRMAAIRDLFGGLDDGN